MKLEPFEVTSGLDRLATPDETQNAVEPFPDYVMKGANETPLEIPSDRGGYVRIPAEEFELLFLIEELNQLTK